MDINIFTTNGSRRLFRTHKNKSDRTTGAIILGNHQMKLDVTTDCKKTIAES